MGAYFWKNCIVLVKMDGSSSSSMSSTSAPSTIAMDQLPLSPVQSTVQLESQDVHADGGGNALTPAVCAGFILPQLRVHIKRCDDKVAARSAADADKLEGDPDFVAPNCPPRKVLGSSSGGKPNDTVGSTCSTPDQQPRTRAGVATLCSDWEKTESLGDQRTTSGAASQHSPDSAGNGNSSPFSVDTSDASRPQPPARASVVGHCRARATGPRHKCGICGVAFCYNSVARHKSDTGEHPYACDTCGDTFAAYWNLVEHMAFHTRKKKLHSCDVCCSALRAGCYSKRRQKARTGERSCGCEVCGKTFADVHGVRAHMVVHTGERPYACHICSKTFSRGSHVGVHMRTHTGDKRHKCEQCGKTFGQKPHLVTHMKIHTGERPYQCRICARAFALNGTLAEHLKTHTGERPYTCHICQQSFTRRSRVKAHLLAHTGERPYKCGACGKTFALKMLLVRHVRIHTGERPYKCDKCDKAFTVKLNLVKHSKIHTGAGSE